MRINNYLFLAFTFLCSIYLQAQSPTVGVIEKSENLNPGYTLLSVFSGKSTYLIDNCGLEVKEWTSLYDGVVAYLLPNGDLLRAGVDPNSAFGNPGFHGILQIFGWNGNLKWQYKLSNDSLILHHDIKYMPNGNILAIGWKKVKLNKILNLGRNNAEPSLNEDLWQEVIIEIKPVGSSGAQIVWQWESIDHTIQDFDNTKNGFGNVSEHPELLDINYAKIGLGNMADWLHFNSVDYNANLDQILISCLTFKEIFIIDHSTTTAQAKNHEGGAANRGGDLLFRWGNPQAFQKGGTSDREFNGQHDAQWVQTGTYQNKIMVFDNKAVSNHSAIDILNPTWNGNHYARSFDDTYMPETVDTSLLLFDGFYSAVMSGASIYGGNHVLACEATKGRITEYDITNHEIVWQYINPIKASGDPIEQGKSPSGNTIFKTQKYAASFSGFQGKNLKSDEPLESNPWDSDCWTVEQEDTTSNEDTTQNDTTGAYVEVLQLQILIYPNPSVGAINIKTSKPCNEIILFDQCGKIIEHRDLNTASDYQTISDLQHGVYLLQLKANEFWYTKKIVVM